MSRHDVKQEWLNVWSAVGALDGLPMMLPRKEKDEISRKLNTLRAALHDLWHKSEPYCMPRKERERERLEALNV